MTKNNKVRIASLVFLLVVCVEIFAVVTKNSILETIFKPLLMTSLAVVYLVSVKKPNFWVVSALFFSFWGDVFLLNKSDYFVYGLACFLVAQLIYVFLTKKKISKLTFKEFVVHYIPFAFIFSGLIYLMLPNLGAMLFPVIVYGLVITTFGALALINYRQNITTENSWLLLGALLFITSDSLIALNKFYISKEIFSVIIIITYIIAQYFIVKSMIAKSE